MGTRGSYGFIKNGVEKLTYNHCDSYPSCLGKSILRFLKRTTIEDLNEIYDSIKMVDGDAYPTNEEERLLDLIGYSTEYKNEKLNWFKILGTTLGDISVYNDDLTFMLEHNEFIYDSLFCEWAYIINLDENVLEVYKGFQKSPGKGRYSHKKGDNGYYGCTLIEKISLDKVNDIEELLIEED